MIKNPKDYVNPFSAKLVESLKRAQREREQRAEIYRETHEIVSRAFDANTFVDIHGKPVSKVAAAILRAGQVRRGEVADETLRFPDTEAGRRAKLICNAARKARGEKEIS
jgi:hypothetical protein